MRYWTINPLKLSLVLIRIRELQGGCFKQKEVAPGERDFNWQYNFKVYFRYMILWRYWEPGTILLMIIVAPTAPVPKLTNIDKDRCRLTSEPLTTAKVLPRYSERLETPKTTSSPTIQESHTTAKAREAIICVPVQVAP